MSDYTGISVDRLSDGSIFQVIVKTEDGHFSFLSREIYIARGIHPPIEKLPEKPKQ
jgi:hypothetical protein